MATVKVSAKVRKETEAALRRLAHAAGVFIEGDVFKAIVIDPDTYTGDDYQVDDDAFVAVKKTLFRLKRISECDASLILWRKCRDGAAIVMPMDAHLKDVKRGLHPMTPAMADAFEGATVVEEQLFGNVPVLSVFEPVRDSMDDVVGVAEVYGSLAPHKLKVDSITY
jgi:hypothetical protein